MENTQNEECEEAYIIKTKKLPPDLAFMPTLCNGHLGFTVYGNAIFMNGLYNGSGGNSRRARIPNWLNVCVVQLAGLPLNDAVERTAFDLQPPVYELHLRDGYFCALSAAAPDDGFSVEQRCYAHRYYTRALIYELIVQREDASASLVFNLVCQPGLPSEALDISDVKTAPLLRKGVTRSRENEIFQPEHRTVFIAFSDNLEAGKVLKMEVGERTLYYRYVISIDESDRVALTELTAVLATAAKSLLAGHIAEWRKFWHTFSIDVKGNLDLAHTINASIFYLANSLPTLEPHQPNLPYYGLSPTGLGRGNLAQDYQGHTFWDTEIWMLPIVTQMSTNWTKDLFQYRLRSLPGAEYNAIMTGYKGARFPWESAFTGTEVTQPDYPEVARHQVHISADIIIALRQFFAATNDREWLSSVAWPLARKIARFLVSRVAEDPATQLYHIKDVMGPDEYHWPVTDNVYTNVVFKAALEFTNYLQQLLCPEAAAEATAWKDVAARLTILYDPQLDYHPQYLGYNPRIATKQADVALLGYPLQFPMNDSTHLNDLNIYAAATSSTGPAMTWSMYSINYLAAGDAQRADFYFQKSYQDYLRSEFKVWSETKIGYEGSANFLTGIGGFLQAIISGYAGVRFHQQGDRSVMEIKSTRLLPKTTQFTIRGLKFADATFKLFVGGDNSTLECLSLGDNALELEMGTSKTTSAIFKGYKTILTETVFIKTV